MWPSLTRDAGDAPSALRLARWRHRVRVRVRVEEPAVIWSPAADLSVTGTGHALHTCMWLPGSVDVAFADAGCG